MATIPIARVPRDEAYEMRILANCEVRPQSTRRSDAIESAIAGIANCATDNPSPAIANAVSVSNVPHGVKDRAEVNCRISTVAQASNLRVLDRKLEAYATYLPQVQFASTVGVLYRLGMAKQ